MSTITQTITSIAPAANPYTMDRDTFSSTAAANVTGIVAMTTELNTWAGQVNTVKGEMNASAVATAADAVATAADAVATAADRVQTGIDASAASASAAAAASAAMGFVGTSTTSLLIGTGSKTFTTQASEQYTAGIWVIIPSQADPANYMYGQVTSYSGTTLIVNITKVGGSGTFADWNISLAGVQGEAGTGITEQATGFTATGGTTPKTLTVDDDLTTSQAARRNADNTLSGTQTMSGKSIIDANASVAAHATTMNPWLGGNYVTLTGTAVTFMALANAPQAGAEVELYMNAAHVFTDGAVFEVDGNANYTAAIGDRVLLRAKSATVFTVHPRKANGTAVVTTAGGLTLGTPVASTSGTSIDFTGIPAGTKQITISFVATSTSGTSPKLIRIGDSGGVEATGYASIGHSFTGATVAGVTSSTGFFINSVLANDALGGSVTLNLENSATFTWAVAGLLCDKDSSDATYLVSGSKSLSAELDRVIITTVNGTDTFDAGEINISYM